MLEHFLVRGFGHGRRQQGRVCIFDGHERGGV
jgi:hypothetical protein